MNSRGYLDEKCINVVLLRGIYQTFQPALSFLSGWQKNEFCPNCKISCSDINVVIKTQQKGVLRISPY